MKLFPTCVQGISKKGMAIVVIVIVMALVDEALPCRHDEGRNRLRLDIILVGAFHVIVITTTRKYWRSRRITCETMAET